MTCKPWDMGGTGLVVRAACSLMLLGSVASVALAQTATQVESPANRYAQMLAEADDLQGYNTVLQRLLDSQAASIADLTSKTGNLDGIAAEVEPLLQQMYDSLAKFVASDLPFLTQERTERIQKLQDLMAQEKDYGEKFRRLMEAYQIEIEYGRVMKTYRDKLPDGREADFLHLGRVSLMYRTVDGSESGYWDATSGKWVADARYARAIANALGMAKELSTPDLIVLPVPAATETHS